MTESQLTTSHQDFLLGYQGPARQPKDSAAKIEFKDRDSGLTKR